MVSAGRESLAQFTLTLNEKMTDGMRNRPCSNPSTASASWLLFLLLPTFAFLGIYVGLRSADPAAIFAHLKIVFFLISGVIGLRIFAGLVISKTSILNHTARAGIVSLFLFVIIGYYGIATIGLYSWNRIFTINLVSSYLGDAFFVILDSFSISPFLFFIVLLFSYTLLFAASNFWERYLHRFAPFHCSAHPFFMLICSILLILISAFGVLSFTVNPRGDLDEPFALTFYPVFFGDRLQSLSINSDLAERYDHIADNERYRYEVPRAEGTRPNVIFFIVDGLRPDHMSAFGYSRTTTPFIDMKRNSGAVAHIASLHSVCADSSCGLLSLASSRYPHEFSNNFFSLYEVLSRTGYTTSLILSGDHRGFYGLAELYGDVDFLADGSQYPDIGMNDDAVLFEMLKKVPDYSGTPSFFQFHLMSAHNLGTRWSKVAEYFPHKNYGFRILGGSREESINFYDNGVRQADHVISSIISNLESKGYMEEHIIVITSDHGEALGEKGHWSHSDAVIDAALKIPFVVISSGETRKGDRKISPITFGSIVDIAPTVLDLLGLAKPETWSGRSLIDAPESRTIFFRQGEKAGLIENSVRGEMFKYWRNSRSGEEFVFDLSKDPEEAQNLLEQVPKSMLSDWRRTLLRTQALVDTR